MQVSEEIIRNLSPFQGLTSWLIEQIISRLSYEEIANGQILIHAGDWDNQTIFLVYGEIAIITSENDKKVADADGELARHAIADAQPRNVSVQTIKDVAILRVDSAILNALLSKNNSNAYQVAEIAVVDERNWMIQVLQSKIFHNIPIDIIMQIVHSMELVNVCAGDVVISQTEEGDYFYFINSGRCSVTRRIRSSEAVVALTELGASDSFSEEALVAELPHTTTVTMLTNGRLHRLQKNQFFQLTKSPLLNQISYKEAVAEVVKGAIWIDFRDYLPQRSERIKNSINVPFSLFPAKITELKKGTKYIAYCEDGSISAAAALRMIHDGFAVTALRGGIQSVPAHDLRPQSAIDGQNEITSFASTAATAYAIAEEEADRFEASELTITLPVSGSITATHRGETQSTTSISKEMNATPVVTNDGSSAIQIHSQANLRQQNAELLSLHKKINELSGALVIAAEKLTTAENTVNEKHAELVSIHQETNELNEALVTASGELTAAENEINEKDAELLALHKKITEANEALVLRSEKLVASEIVSNQKDAELTRLHLEINELNEALVTASEELTSAENTNNEKDAESSLLQEKLTEINEALVNTSEKLVSTETAHVEKDGKLQALYQEIDALQVALVSASDDKLRTQEKLRDEKDTELQSLRQQINELNQTLVVASENLATAETSYTEKNVELQALHQEITELKVALVSASDDRLLVQDSTSNEKDAELQALRQKVNELNQALVVASENLAAAETSYSAKNAELQTLHQEITELKVALVSASDDKLLVQEATGNEKDAELQALREKINELNQTLLSASENLAATENERNTITNQAKLEREKQLQNIALFRRQIQLLEKERDGFRKKFEAAFNTNDTDSMSNGEQHALATQLNEHKESLQTALNEKAALEKAIKNYKGKDKIFRQKSMQEISRLRNELDKKNKQRQQIDQEPNDKLLESKQSILGTMRKREKQRLFTTSKTTDTAANIRSNLAELRKEMEKETLIHKERVRELIKSEKDQTDAINKVLLNDETNNKTTSEKVSKRFLWGVVLTLVVIICMVLVLGNR